MNNQMNQMKRFTLVGGALALLLTGCKLDDNDVVLPPVAYVSLYNASPNSPGLNIIVDQRVINNNSFDYADHTGYLRFHIGNRNLGFGPYGASNIVADTTVKFETDKAYSVFVVDTHQQIDLLLLDDNTPLPAEGKAKIRFLNLSPDAPEVNLQLADNDSTLFDGLAFKEKSDFIEVDAKTYDFEVKLASGGDALLSVPGAQLRDGYAYTILVRGFQAPPGGNNAVLSAEIIED